MPNPVHSTSSASLYSLSATPQGGYLTPEMMLTYLETQMGQTDSDIKLLMDRQERGNQERAVLSRLSSALENLPNDKGEMTEAEQTQINKIFEELSALSPNLANEVWVRLGLAGDPGDETVNLDYILEMPSSLGDNVGHVRAEAKNLLDEMDSGAQMNMIRLQSKISDRNTAISMATNMLSSLSKGMDSVAGNIGR